MNQLSHEPPLLLLSMRGKPLKEIELQDYKDLVALYQDLHTKESPYLLEVQEIIRAVYPRFEEALKVG